MVPRLSLPARTRAEEIPSAGLATRAEVNDSHFPLMPETSILPDEARLSIIADFPIVPAMITGPETPDALVATLPFVPVTSPKSFARSFPARVTPVQSFESITIVGPNPLPPNFSPPAVSENATLAGWPIARVPIAKTKIDTRKVRISMMAEARTTTHRDRGSRHTYILYALQVAGGEC